MRQFHRVLLIHVLLAFLALTDPLCRIYNACVSTSLPSHPPLPSLLIPCNHCVQCEADRSISTPETTGIKPHAQILMKAAGNLRKKSRRSRGGISMKANFCQGKGGSLAIPLISSEREGACRATLPFELSSWDPLSPLGLQTE